MNANINLEMLRELFATSVAQNGQLHEDKISNEVYRRLQHSYADDEALEAQLRQENEKPGMH